ncbi:MAG: hypothetical protein ABI618_12695 [Nitrospirota bacterium]
MVVQRFDHADLKHRVEQEVGPEQEQRDGTVFEQLRAELDYADYLGALQRYRLEHPRDPHPLAMWLFLVKLPPLPIPCSPRPARRSTGQAVGKGCDYFGW